MDTGTGIPGSVSCPKYIDVMCVVDAITEMSLDGDEIDESVV